MKKLFLLIITVGLFTQCDEVAKSSIGHLVKDNAELYSAAENAQAGDDIILANGEWKDVNLRITKNGNEGKANHISRGDARKSYDSRTV